MNKHPHVVLLEKLYAQLAAGEFASALDACDDAFTFQVPGKSKIAGKFTKSTFIQEFVLQLKELSGGSHSLEIHDILSSDLHATVLATQKIERGGKKTELRTVHVWRFSKGKPLAGYEYPRDLYLFDQVWS